MTDEELKETHHKDADMVEILLRAGADPNERVGEDPKTTVWSRFLDQLLYMGPIPIANEPREITFRQAQLLLQHGADPSLRIVDFRSWAVDQELDVLEIVENVFLKRDKSSSSRISSNASTPPEKPLDSSPPRPAQSICLISFLPYDVYVGLLGADALIIFAFCQAKLSIYY